MNGIFSWGGCENVFEVKVGETATHWLKRRIRSDSLESSDITNDVSSSSQLALEITSCAPALQSPATGSKVFAVDAASSCRLVYAGALAPDFLLAAGVAAGLQSKRRGDRGANVRCRSEFPASVRTRVAACAAAGAGNLFERPL